MWGGEPRYWVGCRPETDGRAGGKGVSGSEWRKEPKSPGKGRLEAPQRAEGGAAEPCRAR